MAYEMAHVVEIRLQTLHSALEEWVLSHVKVLNLQKSSLPQNRFGHAPFIGKANRVLLLYKR
jgi:hypothetical protein